MSVLSVLSVLLCISLVVMQTFTNLEKENTDAEKSTPEHHKSLKRCHSYSVSHAVSGFLANSPSFKNVLSSPKSMHMNERDASSHPRDASDPWVTRGARGIGTRFVPVKISDDMASAIVITHALYDDGAIINDMSVQCAMGFETYFKLKQTLAGRVSEAVELRFMRAPDGFFAGLTHSPLSTSVVPELSKSPDKTYHTYSVESKRCVSNAVAEESDIFCAEAFFHITSANSIGVKLCSLFLPTATVMVPCNTPTVDSVGCVLEQMCVAKTIPRLAKSAGGAIVKEPHLFTIEVTRRVCENGGESGGESGTQLELKPKQQAMLHTNILTVGHESIPDMLTGRSYSMRQDGLTLTITPRAKSILCMASCPETIANGKGNVPPTRQLFEVFRAPFSCIVHQGSTGSYVHGMRGLSAHVFKQSVIEKPVLEAHVRDVIGPPCYVSDVDSMCAMLKTFGLVTSKPVPSHLEERFERLGVKHVTLKDCDQSSSCCSVFPLQSFTAMPRIMPKPILEFMVRHGVEKTKAEAIFMGAYAVLSQSHFNTGSEDMQRDPGDAALLNTPVYRGCIEWKKSIIAQYDSCLNKEASTRVLWNGAIVTVTCERHPAGDAVMFSDTKGVFAIGGSPSTMWGCDCYPVRTESTAGVSQNIPDQEKNMITIEDTLSKSMAGAALRLAVIDTLTTVCSEFRSLRETLRSIWLQTEHNRLGAVPTDDVLRRKYFAQKHYLAQTARMPLNVNYWATVPYL